jgi:hypothetical protein
MMCILSILFLIISVVLYDTLKQVNERTTDTDQED